MKVCRDLLCLISHLRWYCAIHHEVHQVLCVHGLALRDVPLHKVRDPSTWIDIQYLMQFTATIVWDELGHAHILMCYHIATNLLLILLYQFLVATS